MHGFVASRGREVLRHGVRLGREVVVRFGAVVGGSWSGSFGVQLERLRSRGDEAER